MTSGVVEDVEDDEVSNPGHVVPSVEGSSVVEGCVVEGCGVEGCGVDGCGVEGGSGVVEASGVVDGVDLVDEEVVSGEVSNPGHVVPSVVEAVSVLSCVVVSPPSGNLRKENIDNGKYN